MRQIIKIDVAKSLALKKLVFREQWGDKIDRVLIYIVFGAMIMLSAFMVWNADFNLPNQRFMSLTALPLMILLGLYVVYRTATEKYLIELTTSFNEEKNRLVLIHFADEHKLIVRSDSKRCMVLDTRFSRLIVIFIIKDNMVLFTVLRDGFRVNLPSLIYHLRLRHKLKKKYDLT